MSVDIEPYSRVSWKKHLEMLNFRQGEHVLLCGPTGCGKTSLVPPVANKRGHVVSMVSKIQKDDTFKKEYKGWHVTRDWPPPAFERRVLLWPKTNDRKLSATLPEQRRVFMKAFDDIGMKTPGWCVIVDEAHYMSDPHFLNLGKEVAILHHQGRSAKTSMITLTQRPAWLPKIIYSSASHGYIARTRDQADLKRLADFGGVDAKELAAQIIKLPDRHDFMYINPQGDIPPHVVNIRQ